jgi:hypothetical protein
MNTELLAAREALVRTREERDQALAEVEQQKNLYDSLAQLTARYRAALLSYDEWLPSRTMSGRVPAATWCGSCRRIRLDSHAPDCLRQAVLGETKTKRSEK